MTALVEKMRCPDCGTELGSDAATEGLCPRCLLSLALVKSALAPPDLDDEAPTLDRPATGQILGDRYQMREILGRGGMGEVWRAFDLKLRVDVALKSVRPERLSSERAHELLRQEVRSAREVVSPNVCRIFDLEIEDGRELVSMEYIDGTTLAEALRSRGPLELQEAREVASQFLAGLEAIHQAGLVHRDFKPENVMLTRAGRVVVMDFGLAKGLGETKTGSISGTPAYMAPEQARGEAVDAQADVYAAGVVLAEMLTVGGDGGIASRQALWKAVRETPPQVPAGPWAAVLKQALDPRPDPRPASALALARALEEVTFRLPGFEEKRPYPGLASFTEEDAEYFFGREAETEAVWTKLKRPRLLALIGPSGTGKSSFIRAGLLATLPSSWGAIVATPGHRPQQSLAQALVPAFSGDAQVMQEFLRFEEPDTAVALVSRWRQQHEHALIVVDQFEELFTLNPSETQAAFAALLGRLVLEADVNVLLALRDDFLFHCNSQKALAPAFADLTPLGTLGDSALRRALVQPALACGYRYEDEALVEEMVGEVGQERGALPLLAFAASRLWEKRDRDRGLLTREAYKEIGGVAGALAQHAESTLEGIGTHRAPLVRELFRNLVTAQGTRAVRERGELLSVFDKEEGPQARTEAEEVLAALVDARLLTSFERAADDSGESRHEIEIIHESLLSRWPRLVRWQTQDADGAQLRDQLRQAAQAWHDRGRPEDLLWSGTAYRDFAVWRERYTGGLTSTEEAFAQAAARLATRRRRRRRMAAIAALAILALGLGVVTTFWARAEESRRQAEAESLRREAAQLVSLGRLQLETRPMAALAHAIASLERIDTEPARRFALEALWRGPTSFVVTDPVHPLSPMWSPDGRWLAVGSTKGLVVLDRDSPQRRPLMSSQQFPVGFTDDGTRLVSGSGPKLHIWSLPEGRLLETKELEASPGLLRLVDGKLLSVTFGSRAAADRWTARVRVESLEDGQVELLSRWRPGDQVDLDIDADGQWVAWVSRELVLQQRLDELDATPRVLGRHPGEVSVWVSPGRDRVVTSDSKGEIRLWNARSGRLERTLRSPAGARKVALDPRGRFIASALRGGSPTGSFFLFDLQAPRGAEPTPLVNHDFNVLNGMTFDPQGRWLASGHDGKLALWNLGARQAFVFRGQAPPFMAVSFAPDGRLVSVSDEGVVRLWALFHEDGDAVSKIWSKGELSMVGVWILFDAKGRVIINERNRARLFAIPLDGSAASTYELERDTAGPWTVGPSIDPAGRRVALSFYQFGDPEVGSIRIVDLASGDERTLRAESRLESCSEQLESLGANDRPLWLPDGRLVSHGPSGFRVWDLSTGSSRVLRPCQPGEDMNVRLRATPDSRFVVSLRNAYGEAPSLLTRFDLETNTDRDITSHGTRLGPLALDPTGTALVTGSQDGVVRVGPLSGDEPHLLFGHTQPVRGVAVSPDGEWIASASDDGTIRLWPMPKGRPFHTLPYEELLGKLRAQTNLQVVPDPAAATGYTVAPGPFPGWAEVPEW